MTNEGLNRICKIFLADIKHLSYKQDGEDKTKTVHKNEIKDNLITLFFKIGRDEVGEFTDFKLLAQDDTVYTSKELSFKKANDEIIVEYPFQFVEGGLIE
ncbi:hypothetical protein [Clostridium botulinum]|uniref:hypothetical protein n=1 Tax=Clostridium botulinum TaxID=1491 RepID=UPI0004D01DC1|nr:hypothetical protein [Clostridium botulinum]AXG97812.1 hypothetical protein AGE31_19680 [Clostridium botulinum]MBY6773638.1 hypothetical protein [Clostridium botulinum]MBY6886042.1 hypothetical protein [Clostridium botulinum]